MKTIYIYILLLISPYFITEELNGQKLLDNYLITAAENNPGLKAKFNEYMAALEVAPQVSALPDPQFAFSYLISYDFFYFFIVSVISYNLSKPGWGRKK
ncbi:hypothetical protein ES705_48594 [subsurface metagenome]